jgi:hypothetical protein
MAALMADRLEVRLHGEQVGWITRGSRRERIEFEWTDGYTPGPVTLTESFGSVRLKAPPGAASSFFGGYALEGRQRERLTQRRGISNRSSGSAVPPEEPVPFSFIADKLGIS